METKNNRIPVNPVSDAARMVLYNELCEAMIEGLKSHIMQYETAQDSAEEILKLDGIKTYPELLVFLGTLSEKWPAYRPVYFLVKEVETKVKDEALMKNVINELKSFK